MKGPLFIKTWVFFTKNALCKFGLNWPSSYIKLNKPESMLCTNFSWIWPNGSGGVFQMLSMYFCYFVIITPLALHLRHPRVSRFLNVVNVVFFTITIFSSLGKGSGYHYPIFIPWQRKWPSIFTNLSQMLGVKLG